MWRFLVFLKTFGIIFLFFSFLCFCLYYILADVCFLRRPWADSYTGAVMSMISERKKCEEIAKMPDAPSGYAKYADSWDKWEWVVEYPMLLLLSDNVYMYLHKLLTPPKVLKSTKMLISRYVAEKLMAYLVWEVQIYVGTTKRFLLVHC